MFTAEELIDNLFSSESSGITKDRKYVDDAIVEASEILENAGLRYFIVASKDKNSTNCKYDYDNDRRSAEHTVKLSFDKWARLIIKPFLPEIGL